MCEIEDFSLGHQDIYFHKYSDCLGANNMDLYITDSLQDMLDIDIKSEMATDLGFAVDVSDSLCMSFPDLPLLDVEMDNGNSWMSGSNTNLHNASSFVQNLDLYGSEANAVMVNPNSVMPSVFSESPMKSVINENSSDLMLNCIKSEPGDISPIASAINGDSHLTFSPNTIKFCQIKEEPDKFDTFEQSKKSQETPSFLFIKKENVEQIRKDLSEEMDMKPKLSTISTLRLKESHTELRTNKNCSILSNQRLNGAQYITGQILGPKTIISGNVQLLPNRSKALLTNGSSPTTILIDNSSFNNNRPVIKTVSNSTFAENTAKFALSNKLTAPGEFPKPAYSYSCLIAMALKNSKTGSLPVSEIYNFMCQHFPYFKTAPNGWKNSVRHNLSLNKCFEKIEKPSTNGGQRKGCLWAMNPSKVGKMDEEVQKWSRKDPVAIRKAMVCPDTLEALERGEMKYCSSEDMNGVDEECSEDDLDVDEMITTEDQGADVEVMEGCDEVEIQHNIPVKLEFALAPQFHEIEYSAKRTKATILHKVNSSPSHANRRKTPLVNRIA